MIRRRGFLGLLAGVVPAWFMMRSSGVEAQPSAANIAIREDLGDLIYDISPTRTPFLVARVEATAVAYEWQSDVLETISDVRHVK